jgi:glutamate synthase domain-containing protein 1
MPRPAPSPVARLDNPATDQVITGAITALENLVHHGAAGADPRGWLPTAPDAVLGDNAERAL